MRLVIVALAAQTLFGGSAAVPPRPVVAEFHRGVAAVGDKPTDAIAVRQESQAQPPSPGFQLGAALAAWRNATSALAYDLHHPSGDGSDAGALLSDCSDEEVAFDHLEAQRRLLQFTPDDVVQTLAREDSPMLAAWRVRMRTRPAHC